MNEDGEAEMKENRLGKMIRQFRREKSFSIKEFSELCGISTALVSQLERGIGNPSLSVLRAIASTLGEALSSLFVGEIRKEFTIRMKKERFTTVSRRGR